jgi:hypoxanthine phosphoribosyltransferase
LGEAPGAWNPAADMAEVVFDEQTIRQRIQEVANAITADYLPYWQQDPRWSLMLVSVLRGAVFFVSDLARALRVPATIDFMAVTAYGETGRVRILKDLEDDIQGRDVILVEDIIDTGLTIGYLLNQLKARRPRSLAIASLIDRPRVRLVHDLPLKYVGFEVGSSFLVGYGLDFRERYRTLPFVGVLKDEVVQEAEPVRPAFAHPSEAEFARMLDFFRIRWVYEPKTFVLRETEDGHVDVGFSPDFYLPDFDLYIELTTKKPHLMDRKLRQIEALRKQHPEIQIELVERADFQILAKKLHANGRS